MCCSNSTPVSIPNPRSPTCAPRSTKPSAICRSDVDEPIVQEVNLSLYPVLVVALAGNVPERTMLRIARNAKNAIEQVPGVLSAELRGARDEAVEIIAEPMLMKSYNISLDQLIAATAASNSLVAAGALEGASGRFAVKVPGLIEKPSDVLKNPVVASAGATVTVGDVATVKPTFKDATSITRVNGHPAMTIEVSKRTGANLIDTVDGVKTTVEKLKATWPEGVQLTFTQDKSKVIRQMLADLQNSVATGVLLVVVIILFALGFRASLFIGIAIPASFLAGVLGLQLAGTDGEYRRSVLAHSCRRHAGRRRHHRFRICRTPHVGRHAAARSLFAGRQAHGRPGDRGDRDARRGVLAAAVLARHRRRIHEIHADHT